jgi:hypothetical protein
MPSPSGCGMSASYRGVRLMPLRALVLLEQR